MPAILNGQNVCDEVAFRIANRLPANGTGAGSIINFTNDILGLIGASASWIWDKQATYSVSVPASPSIVSLGTADLGKKIAVFNSATQTPIVQVMQNDLGSSSAGYIGVGSDLNAFTLSVDPGTLLPFLLFYPPSIGGTIDLFYHLCPPVLTYGVSPTVRWAGVYGMDALLKDWATAATKKYLELSGWDTSWADCLGRLGEFRRMYTTERENTGPADEATNAVQDKSTVGRV